MEAEAAMVTIYLVSEGLPQRQQIIGEVPLRRCIDELGLDPSQRVRGLREAGARFAHGTYAMFNRRVARHVVAAVGAREAWQAWTAGHYWLDVSPEEARRRLGGV